MINKIDELKHVSFDSKPDIICICETWTNSDTLNAFLSIDDYNIICRKDRTDTTNGIGGGLLVYAKKTLICKELTGDHFDQFNQCSAVDVKLQNGNNITVVLTYRPHNLYDEKDVTANNELLCKMIKSVPKQCVIVGDFNYSDINWNNNTCTAKSKLFLDTVQDQFFLQMIDFPTHISGTMSDLVLTDSPNLILEVESFGPLGSSDHSMIWVKLKVNTVKAKRQ